MGLYLEVFWSLTPLIQCSEGSAKVISKQPAPVKHSSVKGKTKDNKTIIIKYKSLHHHGVRLKPKWYQSFTEYNVFEGLQSRSIQRLGRELSFNFKELFKCRFLE